MSLNLMNNGMSLSKYDRGAIPSTLIVLGRTRCIGKCLATIVLYYLVFISY